MAVGAVGKVQDAISGANKIKEQSKYITRIAKVLKPLTTILLTSGVEHEAIRNVGRIADGYCTLVSPFKLIGHANKFFVPGKNDTYRWKLWDKKSEWSFAATVSNTAMAFADMTEAFVILPVKLGFFKLRQVSAGNIACNLLVPVTLTKDAFLAIGSFFGIINNVQTAVKNEKAASTYEERRQAKLEKWEALRDDEAKRTTYLTEKRKVKIEARLKVLGDNRPVTTDVVKKLAHARCYLLACESLKEENLAKNRNVQRVQTGWDLTTNAAQLVLGIIGMTGVVLGLCGIGVAATPAFIIALAAGWVGTQLLLGGKDLYNDFNKATDVSKFSNDSRINSEFKDELKVELID